MTVHALNIEAGQELISTNSKDRGRRVKVKRVAPNRKYVELENLETGRISRPRLDTVAKNYRLASRSTPDAQPARRSPALASRLKTERQRELLRIVKQKFSDFNKRQQHYYLGGGMTTTHVVTATIADVDQLKLFWPKELIQRRTFGGITYVLEGNVMRRVQDAILRTLNELEALGHLEKVGNSDERRWKPTYAQEA